MYVPAEQATSRTAIGRSGSAPSHDTRSSAWIVTSRVGELDRLAGTGHRVGPPAADLDRAVGRRSLRDRAGQAGERRLDRLARRRRPVGRASARPRGRRSSTTPRSRRSPGSALRSPRWYSTTRVAWPEEDRQDARRERVERPAVADPLRGRQPADQRDDVVRGRAGRLGDDEDAVEAGPERRARHGQRASAATSRFASARTGGRASSSGASIDAPAARACPPPPNRPVRTVASTPPGFVRTLTRVARAGLLEQDRDLGRLGLRQQVDDALAVGALGAGRGDVGIGQARPDDPAVVGALEPVEDDARTAAAGRRAWSGRAGARCRTAARRPRRGPPRRPASAASRSGGRRSRCP